MNETVDPGRLRLVEAVPQAVRKRRPVRRLLVLLILAVAAIVAAQRLEDLAPSTADATKPTAAVRPPEAGRSSAAQTVRDAATVVGDMPIILNALGTVTPLANVVIRTQIAGKLMGVGFQEGQMVKSGDYLAKVDSRPYEAVLAQNQAQLAKDTALMQQAQADLARYQKLEKQDSIARQQVDDQSYLVAQDRAAMANDQALIESSKLNISYATIVSPITGRVGLRLIDPGNYVQPSDAGGLVVVTQQDPISVVFSLPEDNLPQISGRIRLGATLPVTVFDRANVKQLAVGTLSTYDNQVDTTTGTIKLRAIFPNTDGALYPNQFVNVRLLVDTMAKQALVPNAAIQVGSFGSFVYVVGEGPPDGGDDKDASGAPNKEVGPAKIVNVRKVALGPADADRTVVVSGLAAGDRVIIDGVDRLRDGARVRIVEAAAAGGDPSRRDKKDGAAKPRPGAEAPK